MALKYPHLMKPVRIGKHLIKNRIIAAPVTLHSASNGESHPTEADSLAGISPNYRPVGGDCVSARTVEAATQKGYFAGVTI